MPQPIDEQLAADHPDAYGADGLTWLDRTGMSLRTRPIRSFVRREKPQRMIDLGCGHNADLLRAVGSAVPERVGVDLEVNRELGEREGIELLSGPLETVLPQIESESADFITLISVLEHLPDPQPILDEMHRILKPGGAAWVHVPTWMGKPVLEFIAFNRGIATESIDDHRNYYAIRQLWPMVIRAGFKPQQTQMRYHLGGFALRSVSRRA